MPTADASGPERAAIVSVEPASSAGAWLVRVARGPSFDALKWGTAFGPFPQGELADRFAEAVRLLQAEGFVVAKYPDLILALEHPSATVRGRAAVRLGWRRDPAAVAPLLMAATRASSDICPIVDALGWIGDKAATDLARELSLRKNLSRRRSGIEALANLGDSVGFKRALAAEQERLPTAIAELLSTLGETKTKKSDVKRLLQAVQTEGETKRALSVDVIYQRRTTLGQRLAKRFFTPDVLGEPHVFRYTKSVLKRAMLRRDAATFGWLSYALERASGGTTASVKSGLDGQKKELTIFSQKTRDYLRRASWRYLRDLGKWQPELYTQFAAAALEHYREGDADDPERLYGAWATAFVLNRILFGQSSRLKINWHNLKHRFVSSAAVQPKPGAREETHPELWDAYPQPFVRLLARAKVAEIKRFAADGVLRHPEVLGKASLRELINLADCDQSQVLELVIGELDRRLERVGLGVLAAVLERGHPALKEFSRQALARRASEWTSEPARVVGFLLARDVELRSEIVRIAGEQLATASPAVRAAIADQVLARLRQGEPEPGEHAALVAFAREALIAEISERLSIEVLLDWIKHADRSAKELAGHVLGQKPGALEAIGLEPVVALADHEVVTVRRAAHRLLEGARATLARQPEILFVLAESEWPDTAELAFDLLRQLELAALGLDGLIGLCDSTRPAVQALGRELVRRHFDELAPETVLFRLAEHPAQDMRRYALELIGEHLRPGVVPLMRIEGFIRACLFDLRPRRELKTELLELLSTRALADVRQAELVAGMLSDVVRTQTVFDFDRICQILARIQLAYPDVKAALRLTAVEVGA